MRDAPHSAHMSAKATKGMPENARRAPFGLLAAVPATQTMASADGRTAAACGLGSEGDGKSAAAGFRRNGGLERAAHRRKLLQPKLKVRSYVCAIFNMPCALPWMRRRTPQAGKYSRRLSTPRRRRAGCRSHACCLGSAEKRKPYSLHGGKTTDGGRVASREACSRTDGGSDDDGVGRARDPEHGENHNKHKDDRTNDARRERTERR